MKERLGTLFQLDYGLVLYDLTSTYFEGLAEENELVREAIPAITAAIASRSSSRWL